MRVKLVLIVATSSARADSIARCFESNAGVQIASLVGADRALRVVQSIRPTLIVVDLPTMETARFCAEARSGPGLELVPILTAGEDDPAQTKLLRDAGASAVLRRPINVAELQARTRQLIEFGGNGYHVRN